MPVDNTYQVGEVQVRVKGEVLTDRLPSLALVNVQAYTVMPPQPEAPTTSVIVNASGVEITNGLKWGWVSGFTEAVHYEYSHDGGVSWAAANSNPQHIGPQVYDKDQVLIRVRANAKEGETNLAGKTLDASGANGDFVVMEFVPMQAIGLVAEITETSYNSNKYGFDNKECWAQFDEKGRGAYLLGRKERF